MKRNPNEIDPLYTGKKVPKFDRRWAAVIFAVMFLFVLLVLLGAYLLRA